MATKRKPTRRSGESGSTLYGALAGLLLGLIVAAVVAFYVTKAPVPFVDRATRQGDAGKLPDPRQAPDPNAGLYGRDGAAGSPPTGPTATAPAPLPGAGGTEPSRKSDDLGALIATLPTSNNTPAAAPAPAASAPPTPIAKVAPTPAPAAKAPVASAAPSASANGSYYLQAGAFRGQDDAESLKARIILLGLPVAVQKAEVNGKPINRVRVGPFARLDDMNRARGRLGENKIETAVVRQ
ncbi:SPOR domain-containing protein [Achromobacter xylosoxidans]|uniref:SPOR domain-containing protein n=1 Tax=Alcaligenes xylosoxydans xylosoxydans TaxID=85698 RepID=UPI001F12DDDE|nr:SPOR domain-containing protein [Achromobacter xylosoxidans]